MLEARGLVPVLYELALKFALSAWTGLTPSLGLAWKNQFGGRSARLLPLKVFTN
jgi:hypothetical protein